MDPLELSGYVRRCFWRRDASWRDKVAGFEFETHESVRSRPDDRHSTSSYHSRGSRGVLLDEGASARSFRVGTCRGLLADAVSGQYQFHWRKWRCSGARLRRASSLVSSDPATAAPAPWLHHTSRNPFSQRGGRNRTWVCGVRRERSRWYADIVGYSPTQGADRLRAKHLLAQMWMELERSPPRDFSVCNRSTAGCHRRLRVARFHAGFHCT
mmetsp:Transcript_8614/g.17830  ORF Transcript_8614/g.17830 Transcript_8614/m.17830 type:complete len:212 (+) Transcript_8614:107-742(+)